MSQDNNHLLDHKGDKKETKGATFNLVLFLLLLFLEVSFGIYEILRQMANIPATTLTSIMLWVLMAFFVGLVIAILSTGKKEK